MQKYYLSIAAHSWLLQKYYPSIAAHSWPVLRIIPTYHPSIAAHSWPVIPTTAQSHGNAPSPPPSPKADDLIAALTDPASLSDAALFAATADAQAAMMRWQDEYFALEKQIATADRKHPRQKDPRKPIAPKLYEKMHEQQLRPFTQANDRYQAPKSKPGQQLQAVTQAKDHSDIPKGPQIPETIANAPEIPAPKVKKPVESNQRTRNDLTSDMEEAAVAPEAPNKRVRKPTKVFESAAPSQAKATKKRVREPTNDAVSVADEQPMAKRLRSATPSVAPPKRAKTRTKTSAPVVKTEVEEAKPAVRGANRSEAMRATWAKRQAEGRNGRHGGAPKETTKAKAAKKK